MKNEFIPYSEALELKELGFKGWCLGLYPREQNEEFAPTLGYVSGISAEVRFEQSEFQTLAPLYQQAFKWFRDKYNLVITIIPSYNYEYFTYYYKCYDGINKKSYEDSRLFRTYEEAEFECLKNLIQIAKN